MVLLVLWIIIVVPSLDCAGFLCGLGEMLVFFGIGAIVFFVWPLLVLQRVKTKFSGGQQIKSEDDNLLDGEL